MKIREWVGLHHPDFEGIFIIEKNKAETFIKTNKTTWEKYDINPDKFIVEDIIIKSKKIQNDLAECFPEWFI